MSTQPEREAKDTLTLDEALAALPDGDSIHTFMSGGVALIGADWDRFKLIDAITNSPRICITGEVAQTMKHGIAIAHPRLRRDLFIETRTRTDTPDKAAVPVSQDDT